MLRTAVTFAVAFGLFLCPLRCFGLFSSEQASTPSSECSCCSHCSKHQTDNSESQPASPAPSDEDCGCDQCFCHGCIIEVGPDLQAADDASLDQFSVEFVDFHADAYLTDSLHNSSTHELAATQVLPSGRLLRISLQSMLL
jgi:hypothetical protein